MNRTVYGTVGDHPDRKMAKAGDDTLMPPSHIRVESFLLQPSHSQRHDGSAIFSEGFNGHAQINACA
jgi:hypothetical protein